MPKLYTVSLILNENNVKMCQPPVKQFENTQSTSEEVADLCRLKTNTAEEELKNM